MEWVEPSGAPAPDLAAQAGVSALVAQILYTRGCRDADSIRRLLAPESIDEWSFDALPNLELAVDWLCRMRDGGVEVQVAGRTSAGDQVALALCIDGLRQLGLKAEYLLEDMGLEGAGGQGAAACRMRLQWDAGHGACLSLDWIGEGRVEIEPVSLGDGPLVDLGRAGLWWAVFRQVAKRCAGPLAESGSADLFALSTIVDAAPMTGPNRALVVWGLPKLHFRSRMGLASLMQKARSNPPATPTSDYAEIAVGSRLRAAERQGMAAVAVELMLSQDADTSTGLAAELEAAYAADRLERDVETDEVAVPAIDAYVGLDELNADLVNEIARIGPFGQGNPKPVLATRGIRLVNPTGTGLSRRHTRLVVEDEEGHRLAGVWWRRNPAAVPREIGDAAYRVYLDTYRGGERTMLEIVAFRPRPTESVTDAIPPLPFAVEDLRTIPNRAAALADIQASEHAIQIWAEGDGEVENAHNRRDLAQGGVLAIWTAPPGPVVLRSVLDRVQPAKVVLLAGASDQVAPGAFMRRLGGLVKGVLSQRQGAVRLDDLAARLGEREAAVLEGLELLAAKGLVEYREVDGRVQLVDGGSPGRPDRQKLVELLAESAAYRRYFTQAPAEEILRAYPEND